MKVFRGVPDPAKLSETAVAIGNFDGVHRGHQALLKDVVGAAQSRNLVASAVTFEPHPKEVFPHGAAVLARVNNFRDKVLDIAACGIKQSFFLNFNARLANMTPREFCEEILVKGLRARWVSVGEDFHFGYKGQGSIAELQAMGEELGFEVSVMPTLFHAGERISSTRLRRALSEDNLSEIQALLGNRYHITARIVHGQALGRQLGFPTINMASVPVDAAGEPAVRGVYAVFVHGLSEKVLGGVATVTCRPTVTADQEKKYLLETNIFDYNEDCYGKIARIEFIEKLRDDKKFNNLDELKSAISDDAARARAIIAASHPQAQPSCPLNG